MTPTKKTKNKKRVKAKSKNKDKKKNSSDIQRGQQAKVVMFNISKPIDFEESDPFEDI